MAITIRPPAHLPTNQCSSRPTLTFPGCPLVVTVPPKGILTLPSWPAVRTPFLSQEDPTSSRPSTHPTNRHLRSSLPVKHGAVLLSSTEWDHHQHHRICRGILDHMGAQRTVEEASNKGGMRTDLPQCRPPHFQALMVLHNPTGHHRHLGAMVQLIMLEAHCTNSSTVLQGTLRPLSSSTTKR